MQTEASPELGVWILPEKQHAGIVGRALKWEIPYKQWVNLLQFPAAWATQGRTSHGFARICGEREK